MKQYHTNEATYEGAVIVANTIINMRVGDILSMRNSRSYLKRIDARRINDAKSAGLVKYSKYEFVEY